MKSGKCVESSAAREHSSVKEISGDFQMSAQATQRSSKYYGKQY